MRKLLLLSFILLFACLTTSAQTDWKLSTETDGIKVYTSIFPGSKIKAVKVECEFKASASQFIAVIMDIKGSPEWLYHTKSCTVIKQVSPSELYYYSEVTLPWPAQNRDFVSHLSISQNPGTKLVTIDGPAVPGFVPLKDGIVRVDHSGSQWLVTPQANGEVNVKYTLHVDPGGALPAWLVNMFAAEGPVQIFKKLKLQLQKPAYRNAVLPYIQN
jgi:hypothetical protein